MPHCSRMNRPCACDRLVTYDRTGHLEEHDNWATCLADHEIRTVLAILLRETRQRCDSLEAAIVSA